MKILALDTSTEYCSVALWQDGAVHERFELVGQKHSELLMPMLAAVLDDTSIKLNQLDGIAFGMGPGSFTGVRIACGVAQGLALGANLPVVGIVTLQALAQAAGHDKVITAIDARMGEIYHAAYQRINGEWQTVVAPNLCQAAQAPSVIGDDWFACGSGFVQAAEQLAQRYSGQILRIDASSIPRASAIAQLAAPILAAGGGLDASLALPLYLRDKVALKTHEREQAKLAVATTRISA